jgi:hypothetical protein
VVVFKNVVYEDAVVANGALSLSLKKSTLVMPVPVTAAVTAIVPDTVVLASGEVIVTPIGLAVVVFDTVTTYELVALFPAASYATALRRNVVLVLRAVFQLAVYGAVVSDAISVVPTYIFTRLTPTLSEAEALIVVVPARIDPATGATSETVGAIVSAVLLLTVTVATLLVLVLPAMSMAIALTW